MSLLLIRLLEAQIALIRWLLEHDRFDHSAKKETLTMTLVTTNDNAVRLRPSGLDRDGVAITPTGLEVTVDKPDVASVTADAANEGAFLITPLAASDPAAGARTVVVTTRDPNTGLSTQTPIEFDPGAEASLSVIAEVVPQVAAA